MSDDAAIAGYNRKAPRKAVSLSLNEDLVLRARNLTRNLSGTVEDLLADFVRRKQTEDNQLEEVIDSLNARHERDGLLSDEFSSL